MGFGRVVYKALQAWIKTRKRASKAHTVPPHMAHPQKYLSPEQEKMATQLSHDYGHLGLSLDDVRACMVVHPNLSEVQLRTLFDRYSEVIDWNPNLVKKYGALAVFDEFIALSAYDPAHGGNYTNRKPSVERQVKKGMEEAVAQLGTMEMGKVPWPLTPSTENDYEGTDPNGQAWDVKAPRSATPDGQVFDAKDVVDGMQKDFDLGENIILDDRNITLKEIQELYEQLKAKGQSGRVVWWPIDPKP